MILDEYESTHQHRGRLRHSQLCEFYDELTEIARDTAYTLLLKNTVVYEYMHHLFAVNINDRESAWKLGIILRGKVFCS